MRDLDIIIAGGGIGGLTAGIALLRGGNRVRVFEAAKDFGEVGAGVTLAPNAMLGYQALNLGARIEAQADSPHRQVIRHWQDGRVMKVLERGDSMREKYGAPYLYIHRADLHAYIHRADLHAILLDAVRELGGGETITSGKVERAGIDGGKAFIELADGDIHQADLVIGADGVRSAVRSIYEPISPHFTGHVAFRGIVPVDEVMAEFAANPGNFIGPDRIVVWYPLRSGRQLNLVFFVRQEGWTQDGWTIPATREELRAIFAGWCQPVRQMIDRLDEGRLFKWAINARTALGGWNKGGHITLLGDAAHAMTPFMGQGASSAIEDAVVLGRAVAASETLPEALERYQAARIERATLIQQESNANANRLQSKDTDSFDRKKLRNEETLGLFAYDSGSVPV